MTTIEPHKNPETINGAEYYWDLTQRSDEWRDLRTGIITASDVGKLLTPKLEIADNATSRGYIYALAAQRITKRDPDTFVSFAMERGILEEETARAVYAEKFAPVRECGFVRRRWTWDGQEFAVGYSPDGFVGDDGCIEIKSRDPKIQVQMIVEDMPRGAIPKECAAQVFAAMLVSGRSWCDYVSYSNGFNLAAVRVAPDDEVEIRILDACAAAEAKIRAIVERIRHGGPQIVPVEYVDHAEDIVL